MTVVCGRLAEITLTLGASVGLLTCMYPLVSFQVGFMAECHYTIRTFERLLFLVYDLMDSQV